MEATGGEHGPLTDGSSGSTTHRPEGDEMLSPTTYARTTPCDDDRLLWQQHRARRDRASREALVERYLPFARHLARRYAGGGEEEDLVQVASLGLLKAIDRFDPARGIAFSSYAAASSPRAPAPRTQRSPASTTSGLSRSAPTSGRIRTALAS
jgi:hypothetical protein